MKKLMMPFLAAGIIGAGFAGQSFAQNVTRDKRESREAAAASSIYVISAKAGAVNYVSGKVLVVKKNARVGYLTKGDTIEKEERVRTGGDGKAEILLNPGSYVRLSENADFKFNSTSLDDLQISLASGSAIFEIITDDDFNVAVSTPGSNYQLVKSGVYRIDALSNGSSKISVWKGKAKYGVGKNDFVKGGQTTAIVNGQVSIQKFDRDNKGEFEVWSKDRAKEIARVNARLQKRAMSRTLIYSYMQGGYSTWGRTNRFGLWIFDASNGYCFLPFGYGGSSPYGFGFDRSIWSYSLPGQIYNNINPNWGNPGYQPPVNNGNNGSNGNNGGWGNPGNGGNSGNTGNMPPPRSEPSNPSPLRDNPSSIMQNKDIGRSPGEPTQIQTPTRVD